MSQDALNHARLDIDGQRHEYLFKLPDYAECWLLGQLEEKRDIPILRLLGNITLVLLPIAAFFFWLRTVPAWLGFPYLVGLLAIFLERFMLSLHFSSHRRPFPKGHPLNFYAGYILGPFFGIPPGMYHFHHIVMHHIENNVFPYDVSSTAPYQRDSFFHFLHYWLRYMLAIWVQLPYYLLRRGRVSLFVQFILNLAVYGVVLTFAYRYSPSAFWWVFGLPFLVGSAFIMFGNWSQHIFIDPKRPKDSYGHSYNLVGSQMNQRTYNDGYHLVHHLASRVHWSELPAWFLSHEGQIAEHNGLTFRGLDFFQIGVHTMFGKINHLAKHYVNIGDDPKHHRTVEEVEAHLRTCLGAVPTE